jgi:hypothetical protein
LEDYSPDSTSIGGQRTPVGAGIYWRSLLCGVMFMQHCAPYFFSEMDVGECVNSASRQQSLNPLKWRDIP